MDITDLPAHRLSDPIRRRQVSCREVMQATLARIEAVNPVYNAVVSLCDGLALPAAQVRPFVAALRWPASINARTMDTYHRWMEVVIYATFAGLPCISVPVGFSEHGLPTGMQIIGPPRGDLAVLRIAHRYEQAAREVLNVRPRAHRSPATPGRDATA